MRLLIVDDDAELRATLDEALSDEHELEMVATASEALALGPERFDGIFTDYRMPVMSGLELRALLQERGVPAPVVLMSADPDVGQRASLSGFFDFLRKPFDLSHLQDVLARIAGNRGRPWSGCAPAEFRFLAGKAVN
jgi:CheY-like chemotaxis protein